MEPNETEKLLSLFSYEHLPEHLKKISKEFHDLAHYMVPNPAWSTDHQTITGLQKLIEAKDCFVRATLLSGK